MLSDKDILDYVAPDGKIIPQRCLKSVLKKHGFYEYIINRYDKTTPIFLPIMHSYPLYFFTCYKYPQ